MKIIKTKKYQKDVQRKIIDKHKKQEKLTIDKIEKLMIESDTMNEVMDNPLSKVYKIKKKKRRFKRNLYCEC